ncbi:MAG: hypothetical protein AB7E80_10665 [Hyphomicrobiaceae bacterium]
MITDNPFSALSETLPVSLIQAYVLAMFVLVVLGTLIDVVHKKSATYFFANAQKAQKQAKKKLSSADRRAVAFKTVAEDVLTSAEFCNPKRRMSHLLTMYGFLTFIITTVLLVFVYPKSSAPVLSMLWHLGALMVLVGGLWFWFFIRVDLAAEGNPWNRIVKADMFILSLLATTGLGLIWSILQSMGAQGWTTLFLILFIIASTVLFGGVIWSKFAHMFFKPAAAYQKRIAKADGSLDMLPAPADRNDPADRDRHSMELLQGAPMNMGLGIKREAPQHY